MSRTTPTLVRVICAEMDSSFTDAQVQPFLDSASMVVTNLIGSYYTDDSQLELIERWLSAHYFTANTPKTANEKAGDVSEAYQFTVGVGLKGSLYGQKVLEMDISGRFANWQRVIETGIKRPTPGILFVGVRESCKAQPGFLGGAYGLFGAGYGG